MLSSHLDARARISSFTQLTHYVRANPRPQWPPIAPRRTLMAAAVSLHPAAADSSLLPGWTASGRGALSGALIGFGAAVVYVGPRPSPRALQRTRALLSPLYCHDHNVQRVACCGAAPVAVVLS